MTTTPALTGRDIGIAYQAIAAIRERLLADVGMTFEDSIQVSVLADRAGSAPAGDVAAALIAGLKVGATEARRLGNALVDHGLATRNDASDTLHATELALAAHERFNATVARLAPRLYGDIPTTDLDAARRVLATVTDRANRELTRR